MSDIKITKIETAMPQHVMPGLLALRIHTDAGYIGCGETYYVPHAVASMIHDWMARRLLGADPGHRKSLSLSLRTRRQLWRPRDGIARHFGLRPGAVGHLRPATHSRSGSCWAAAAPVDPGYNSSGGPAYGGRGERKGRLRLAGPWRRRQRRAAQRLLVGGQPAGRLCQGTAGRRHRRPQSVDPRLCRAQAGRTAAYQPP